jgi:hypothetical protein
MAEGGRRQFFSGFFTTIVFVAIVAGVLGGVFLVTALLTNTGGT